MTLRLIGLSLSLALVLAACAENPRTDTPAVAPAVAPATPAAENKTCELQYRVGSNIPTRDCRKQAESDHGSDAARGAMGKPGG